MTLVLTVSFVCVGGGGSTRRKNCAKLVFSSGILRYYRKGDDVHHLQLAFEYLNFTRYADMSDIIALFWGIYGIYKTLGEYDHICSHFISYFIYIYVLMLS